ncbi:hypothetical protein [Mangrovimonas aestuarii]|uniref:hypothetical protein n=1 Tax=Mangrovimonas aestuarii TaxID=3018443 RepID=UPI0023799F9A|nr:hypothetical protein [Mangrovimonas aestuarii]
MKSDKIDNLFETLQNDFDILEPKSGHRQRFLDKLEQQETAIPHKTRSVRMLWRPMAGIAALLALFLAIAISLNREPKLEGLAAVSPKMANTESFFVTTINEEIRLLNKEVTPQTQHFVNDALKQLEHLENEYEVLKSDLATSGNDSRVIYAMISNFQNRIDVLQTVLEQIETFKNLKKQNYENNNTI